METHLAAFAQGTRWAAEAEAILRRCVHCGFCTATCPTYRLIGDELDGPRGRIYLIKQVLEGQEPSARTQTHLDRCLTCRSCETTCPSGVEYARLLDIGRALVETRVTRPPLVALQRRVLRSVLPRPWLFRAGLTIGRAVRGALPQPLRAKIPPPQTAGPWPQKRQPRTMIALAGCVQPALYPDINAATARVLDTLGISLIEPRAQGCCGAVRHHLAAENDALDDARRNIDAWWPWIEGGAEALVITASGCGAHVREYGHLLRHDPAYAYKAERIAEMTRDISQVVLAERDTLRQRLENSALARRDREAVSLPRIAVHTPCSLQHGLRLRGLIEEIVDLVGAKRVAVADGHLCCGSAGTYSLLQPELAQRLKNAKLTALNADAPNLILSANVGCIAHLAPEAKTGTPIRHWIEWLAERL